MPDPYFISLVADKNGILYAVDANLNDLYRYDPHTNTSSNLGTLPSPDGDMVFYNDILLYSGGGSVLYAVDLSQPSASKQYMSTGFYSFYGLIAAPYNCSRNKFYGITNDQQIIEIDPSTKKVVGKVCATLPFPLDGASTLEDGTIPGLSIGSLNYTSDCRSRGLLIVAASDNTDGSTVYTLDNQQTNSTGAFTDVSPGQHSIHIQTSSGCQVDSIFTLTGSGAKASFQIVNPQDCAHNNGSILIQIAGNASGIEYTINDGPGSSTPTFSNLAQGDYNVRIDFGNNCQTDTLIKLKYLSTSPFPFVINITPTICTQKNGIIRLDPVDGISSKLSNMSLNEGPRQINSSFENLDQGVDTIHVSTTDGCKYDSVIKITGQIDPEPAIVASIANQSCFENNGKISLKVIGQYGPYFSSFDSGPLSDNFHYSGLSPAQYNVSIQDKNGCSLDTSFTILPYPRQLPSIQLDTINPTCTNLKSGSVAFTVTGDEYPYLLGFNNSEYPNGTHFDSLSFGAYSFTVINKDGCVVDTVLTKLSLDIKPECRVVYVPSAFSPNGDGINDEFRVVNGAYQKDLRLNVYNRNGALIFSSNDAVKSWNGTFRGQQQPAGVYIWTLEYIDWDNKPKRVNGTLVLVR
jgi:gliding motility-associated-like protein